MSTNLLPTSTVPEGCIAIDTRSSWGVWLYVAGEEVWPEGPIDSQKIYLLKEGEESPEIALPYRKKRVRFTNIDGVPHFTHRKHFRKIRWKRSWTYDPPP